MRVIKSFYRYRQLTIYLMVGLFSIYIFFHTFLMLSIGNRSVLGTVGSMKMLTIPYYEQISNTFITLLFLFFAFFASLSITNRLHLDAYERILSLGLICFTLIVFPAAMIGEIADWIKIPLLKPPLGLVLSSIPSIVLCIYIFIRGWKPRAIKLESVGINKLLGGFIALCIFTYVVIILTALVHPATGGDALSYHSPLAVLLWREGNLGSFLDQSPDIWALAHPGVAELWFGLLRTGAGEWLANLGQFPFSLLGVSAIYTFSRRLGLRSGASLLAGLAFLMVPMVVMQSVMQQNDIVGSVLLMATITLACAPLQSWDSERYILLCIGLGLTATTKLALLPPVTAIAVFIIGVLISKIYKSKNKKQGMSQLTIFVISFLIIVSPWWIRNIIRFQNPIYPSAIPFIGRGVFVPDLGRIDTSFVPSSLAWPLYPLIEPHDDRSGFGALFLIAVIPGFLFAFKRAKKQPLAIFIITSVITLPAWWIFTLHEPRFFLGFIGLSFAFFPWAVMAIQKKGRYIGAIIILLSALFSIAVTFDQDILTFVQQPLNRADFYDQVWGIDASVTSLPEDEGILLNTGFAPSIHEYTATYPLLGPTQERLNILIDGEHATIRIVEKMKENGVQYAYVASSPENIQVVKTLYDPTFFDLVHQTSIIAGAKSGARRNLYRSADDSEQEIATQRFLFRLK
jgi:hypothetical protein